MRATFSPERSDSIARLLSIIGLPPVMALPTALLAYLRRHTLAQVAVGALTAAPIILLS